MAAAAPALLSRSLPFSNTCRTLRLGPRFFLLCHACCVQEVFGRRWTELASKYFEEYQHLCYRVSISTGPTLSPQRSHAAALQPF